MAKRNSIEKQKGALTGIGIASLVLGLIAVAGGVVLVVLGANRLAGEAKVAAIVMLVAGIVLALVGFAGLIFGIYTTWIGGSLKATKGSIAVDNLSKGTVNGKKCPKCGVTNTSDVTECQVCHTPLE